jgi:helicase
MPDYPEELSPLTEAGIPSEYVEHLYSERGVDSLWEPQVQALDAGILDDENFLVVSEAGSGKTMLAEFVMLYRNLTAGGCGVFLVPFKPLADEKEAEFREGLSDKFGLSIDSSIGNDITPPKELFSSDIVVLTFEKFSYYLRNYPEVIDSKITSVIVDEFQTLNDSKRGPGLEITITKLLHDYENIKLVGLSATAANGEEIADWLDGKHVDCRGWRPNPLYEGIYATRSNKITFYRDGQESGSETCDSELLEDVRDNAVTEYLRDPRSSEGTEQAMVFAPTRSAAQSTAEDIAVFINNHPKSYDFGVDEPAADELRSEIESAARRVGNNIKSLKKCIRWGTAFYHAGLDTEVRSVIEQGFKDGTIRALASTSNLGAGINLPVDRIYIQYPRYGSSFRGEDMTTAQYKNLAGRAGRPDFSSRRGEAILFAEDFSEEHRYRNTYVEGDLEPISSQIDVTDDLDIMLDIVREYRTPEEIYSFLDASLFGSDHNLTENKVKNVVSHVAAALEEHGMIEKADGGIRLTDLGEATSKELVQPETVHQIREFLVSADLTEPMDKKALLTVTCGTPEFDYMRLWHDRQQTNLRTSELRREYNLQHLSDNDVAAVYTTASVVTDWLEGVSIEEAFDDYSVIESRTPADVYERLAPELTRVLRTVIRILEASDSDVFDEVGEDIEQLADQLYHGLDQDGLEFAKADIASSRQDVRALRERIGIETVEELAATDTSHLMKRMSTREAVDTKRGAVNYVYDGRRLEEEEVLLDVTERSLSEASFERLLDSHTDVFENTCVDLLEQVDTLYVERANEEGRTEEPECWVKIKQPDGSYMKSESGDTLKIAVECKSKKSDKSVSAKEARAVATKAPNANVKITIGTPSFREGTEDGTIKNDVLAMPVTSFAAFIARAINSELSRDEYKKLFSEVGIVSIEDIRSIIDD